MEQKTMEWLKAESEKWVFDGIITQEQCSQIQTRYSVNKASNPLLVLFSVIGSLLIGAGIILVFATNWWSLPLELRIVLAFLPLLLAQGICLFTWKRKYDSAAFREGATVFLSLSFFAALALIGQIFHLPGDLETYLLVCTLFTLPGAYLFRAKAAMTIYVAGSISAAGYHPSWIILALTALSLPFFYREVTRATPRRGINFLLLLLSLLTVTSIIKVSYRELTLLETALLCGLALLVIDALFHRIGSAYFFTAAKQLSILLITATILIASAFTDYSDSVSMTAVCLTLLFSVMFVVLRRGVNFSLASTDLIFVSAVILLLSARVAGLVACLLTLGLGVFYIVCGSRSLALRKLNYGMVLVISIIMMRFFDSFLGLLGRGVVFILLGVAFLGINLYVSRKRKGMQQ